MKKYDYYQMTHQTQRSERVQTVIDLHDNDLEIKNCIKAMNGLPEKMKAAVIHSYQKQKKSLDLLMEEELRQLKDKYDMRCQKIYHHQNQIIDGKRSIQQEELRDPDPYRIYEQYFKVQLQSQGLKQTAWEYFNISEIAEMNQILSQDPQPFTGYWLRALKHSDIVAQEIKERDEAVLKYLTKIEYIPNSQDKFSLKFTFRENEFIKKSSLELTKTFYFKDGENLTRCECNPIEWHDGKQVTKRFAKNKQVDKNTGTVTIISEELDAESFFNFFQSINLEDKQKLEKLRQEQKLDKAEQRMDIDYDIARVIIDELIPYSLEYYVGINHNGPYDTTDDKQYIEDDIESQASLKY